MILKVLIGLSVTGWYHFIFYFVIGYVRILKRPISVMPLSDRFIKNNTCQYLMYRCFGLESYTGRLNNATLYIGYRLLKTDLIIN